jgi:hypothetical protein
MVRLRSFILVADGCILDVSSHDLLSVLVGVGADEQTVWCLFLFRIPISSQGPHLHDFL